MYNRKIFTFFLICTWGILFSQYRPQSASGITFEKSVRYADSLYARMSLEEKIGQLYIVALYTNKDEAHIAQVRSLVEKERLGGLILMQDDAEREISLLNEFNRKSRIPLLVGMDAEWGLFQRIASAHKFPWAISLGAIQDNQLIYEMGAKIADDAKKMGVYWNFAPVVDVNTNPLNPIIGNRSFGSDVKNVIEKGLAYAKGLQDNGVLAAIKHFPGHGDTDTDSHLDLPVISHSISRLNQVELAPFRALMHQNIGGVMVAHLYVPALEKGKGVPASVSQDIVTGLLKNQLNYQGLIITDALNMNAVAKKYEPGELDLLAFKAGNDILLFSQDVPNGKKRIAEAIQRGDISEKRLAESVKKILSTKYLLDLPQFPEISAENINQKLNNESHKELTERLYSAAVTLLKNDKNLLPLKCNETYYYVPLEEAAFLPFHEQLNLGATAVLVTPENINAIPPNAKVIVGLHKDNSTAYKPYKISEASKTAISRLAERHSVILNVFGSPYALRDLDFTKVSALLVSYENNDLSQKATAKALLGKTTINGRLPVTVNDKLKSGAGIDLQAHCSLPAERATKTAQNNTKTLIE